MFKSGGAGEGKQHLKPDGAVQNQKQVKTDAALPAYCNPPNPCPIGYNAEDGCLEEFENTAAFSREYQSAQDCMCDSDNVLLVKNNTEDGCLEEVENTAAFSREYQSAQDCMCDSDNVLLVKNNSVTTVSIVHSGRRMSRGLRIRQRSVA
ncbi:Neuroendocrine protein 7B2 [Homalodisca vitripennis]|nr:Neuroendocrine protein 7B2 [Homalodisca vitripennis]